MTRLAENPAADVERGWWWRVRGGVRGCGADRGDAASGPAGRWADAGGVGRTLRGERTHHPRSRAWPGGVPAGGHQTSAAGRARDHGGPYAAADLDSRTVQDRT